MDRDDLDPARHRRALEGLARLNALSLAAGIVWPGIREAARAGPIRVLDVATGAGDLPVRLFRRARRSGMPIEFAGCDRSPVAVEFARRRAERAGAEVRFFRHDALDGEPTESADVVICSLFLHHLKRPDAVRLLARLGVAAQRRLFVADLRRSAPGWLLAWAASRAFTGSRVVRTDATRSVEGAFTVGEVREMAEEAGLVGATVRRCRAFRWLLTRERPS
jgi:SAM-dependent methyltransferase